MTTVVPATAPSVSGEQKTLVLVANFSNATVGCSAANVRDTLFTDPSADRAREAFAAKPRALTDKVTTVADAVARLIRDGDYLAIGGFGCDRLPTAVLHEVLRQRG